LILFSFSSCRSGQNGTDYEGEKTKDTNSGNVKAYRLISPENNEYVHPGQELLVHFEPAEDSIIADSIQILFKGKMIHENALDSEKAYFVVPKDNPGAVSLRILLKLSDGKEEAHSMKLRLTSDIVPDNYRFVVKRTYPHDKGAFTQGLEYKDGFIYEGTGNYGESSLRKVDLATGEILKFKNLSSDLFGEGITLINNQIYQITYREQVGFVYDHDNFELIRKIYYQNREGWGLTNNGENILMSDGSHNIYFMDTTYFSVVSKIEVFDNEKEVDLLNELELINGVLYANRYTTEEIVMVDPQSGKLLGRIDMTGILNEADRHSSIDYFNGIAWDEENERIFVTGKYWPKLYEVEFVKISGSE
jgi:glutamine cyclotransferase